VQAEQPGGPGIGRNEAEGRAFFLNHAFS
jgi:hypothetical protein